MSCEIVGKVGKVEKVGKNGRNGTEGRRYLFVELSEADHRVVKIEAAMSRLTLAGLIIDRIVRPGRSRLQGLALPQDPQDSEQKGE